MQKSKSVLSFTHVACSGQLTSFSNQPSLAGHPNRDVAHDTRISHVAEHYVRVHVHVHVCCSVLSDLKLVGSVCKTLQSDHSLWIDTSTKNEYGFLCLLQVSALYLIFALTSAAVADSIFYLN